MENKNSNPNEIIVAASHKCKGYKFKVGNVQQTEIMKVSH